MILLHYYVQCENISLVKSFTIWSIWLTYYAVMVNSQIINLDTSTNQNSIDGRELVDPLLTNQSGLVLLL